MSENITEYQRIPIISNAIREYLRISEYQKVSRNITTNVEDYERISENI